MGVTVIDIARVAGVGRSTVMRALSDKGDVSPETRERILKIAAEMKYRPNSLARGLVTGKSKLVGVIADPGFMPDAGHYLPQIEHGLRDGGYDMLFYTTTGLPGSDRKCIDQVLQNRVAGVILVYGSAPSASAEYQELIDSGIRVVMIGASMDGLSVPQLFGSDYQTSCLAVDHLVSLGHKDIVCLALPQDSYSGRERARGFRESMEKAGLSADDSSIINTGFGPEAGREAMSRILRRKKLPTAVIARHDYVAIGAIRAVTDAGLSVPGDISVVGNTNVWFNDMLAVPLTTIRHPRDEMMKIGVRDLLDMLADKPVEPRTEVLEVELIVRASTGPVRKRL